MSCPHHSSVCHLLELSNAVDKIEVDEGKELSLMDRALNIIKIKDQLGDWTDALDSLAEVKSVWKENKASSSATSLVALIARASSFLSYPLTALHQIQSFPLDASSGRPFTILILGASEEAECKHLDIWSKALASKINTEEIVIQFVGPDVPLKMHRKAKKEDKVTMVGWRGTYKSLVEEQSDPNLPESLLTFPDFCLGFNMGLTCPDYSWTGALKALKRKFKASKSSTSLVIVTTSNTYAEGVMEGEVWEEQGWMELRIDNVPPNPFCSLEVLQSGTLSNDIYRKNAWVSAYGLVKKKSSFGSGEKRAKKKSSLEDQNPKNIKKLKKI